MTEIRNNFLKGRMNKDLDERLVPKGEYRDALNIEVSTSEGSDIGTVQNILGNLRVDNSVFTTDNNTPFKCVGSIADEQKNRLFWFLTSRNTDAIIEWDDLLQTSTLVFVDINKRNSRAALKFTEKLITGINIIDDFLFFTDGISEPKKINIPDCKLGTTSLTEQTRFFVNSVDRGNIREEHITVIKKRPSKPLYFNINHSDDITEKGIFERTFPRFSYRYKYSDGEYSAFAPFTSPVFSAKHAKDFNDQNFFSKKEGYNTSMLNTIESVELMDFVPSDIPNGVVQVDILFKREDSNVVYTVASIKENDEEFNLLGSTMGVNVPDNFVLDRGRYTITTENIYSALPENQILRSWDNVPTSALAQEIIANRLVYANYKQGYDVGNTTVKLNSSYETRNLFNYEADGFPSIKAQRDYQIGVVYGDKQGRETPVLTSNNASVKIPWFSNNVYQGEGPNYLSSLLLTSSVQTSMPSWVDYYKFYIKETSGEYYNLLLNKLYIPSSSSEFENENDHVWLAFNSSDINKIKENDYIILKKVSSSTEKPVETKNRYKIIDIKEEAPDSIAYVYLDLAQLTNANDVDGGVLADGVSDDALFTDFNRRIDNTTDVLLINSSAIESAGFARIDTVGAFKEESLYISWKKTLADGTETFSKRYRIVQTENSSGGAFPAKLDRKISRQDAQLAVLDDTIIDYATEVSESDKLHPNLTVIIEKKVLKDGEDFSGLFFAQILSDEVIENNLIALKASPSLNKFIQATNSTFWWADNQAEGTEGENEGVRTGYDSSIPHAQPASLTDDLQEANETTNTEQFWSQLTANVDAKAMFVDNMYMTAANLSESNYAKNAGQGVLANEVVYSEVQWNVTEDSAWEIDGDTSWSDTNFGGDWVSNIRNAMPGIITATQQSVDGPAAWKKEIYSQELDDVYGSEPGGIYMHLSFFAPGKDLHDGSFEGGNSLENIDVSGEDSIAGLLKGIWGGGAFTFSNGSTIEGERFIEFESNYLGDDALGEAPAPGVGKGYDLEYQEQHERQWDPTYSPNSTELDIPSEVNLDLNDFVSNLKIGSKFKFEGDSGENIYTILDVRIKHIYNHTPWRSKWDYTGDSILRGNNSVEEAAASWAQAKLNNNEDVASLAEALCSKIRDFGKANNRRTCYILKLDKDPSDTSLTNLLASSDTDIDVSLSKKIQFINSKAQAQSGLVRNVSGVFETEPKDSLDLNIFHEAGQAIPKLLETINKANLFAPIGCRVEFVQVPAAKRGDVIVTKDLFITEWGETEDSRLFFTVDSLDGTGDGFNNTNNEIVIDYLDSRVRFYRPDGSFTTVRLLANDDDFLSGNVYRNTFIVDKNIDASLEMGINWHNIFTFKNGVESNRIQDNFNQPFIGNGPRVSTIVEEPYAFEEHRKHGLIYSGIYNATTGINNLNQFIAGEKITKDLNPTYGSIQKLFTRQTDLVAFCEDRILKILANKDALFNADGNPQLVATTNVLGQAVPFVGEFGISKNPESFSSESYRAYFTDKQRGAVLRLSMDGLTPISDAGMHDFFRDALPEAGVLLGHYDEYKQQYNLTLKNYIFENVIQNSYVTEGEELTTSTSIFQILQGASLESGINFMPVDINQTFLSGGDNAPVPNPNFALNVTAIEWPGIPTSSSTTYIVNSTPAVYTYEIIDLAYEDDLQDIQDGSIQTNLGETVEAVTTAQESSGYPVYMNSYESAVYNSSVAANNSLETPTGNDISGAIDFQSQFSGTNTLLGNIYKLFTAKNGSIIFYTETDSFNDNNSSVAAQFPNAPSNGAFFGEEFQVIVKYRGERNPVNFGGDGNPKIKVTLIDQNGEGIRSSFTGEGISNMDMGYFLTDPNPFSEPAGLLSISYTHGLVEDYTGVDNSVEIGDSTNYDGALSAQFNEALSGDYGDVSSHEVVSLGRVSSLNGSAEWPAFGGTDETANALTNAMCGTSGLSGNTKKYTKSKSVALTFRVAPSPATVGLEVQKIGFEIEVTGCPALSKTSVWFEDVSITKIKKLNVPGYAGVQEVTSVVPADPAYDPILDIVDIINPTQVGSVTQTSGLAEADFLAAFNFTTATDSEGIPYPGNATQQVVLIDTQEAETTWANFLESDPNYDPNYGDEGGIPPWTEWYYSTPFVTSGQNDFTAFHESTVGATNNNQLLAQTISLQSTYAQNYYESNPGSWVNIPAAAGGGQYYSGSNPSSFGVTSNATASSLSFLTEGEYSTEEVLTHPMNNVNIPAINALGSVGVQQHTLTNWPQLITASAIESNSSGYITIDLSNNPLIHGRYYMVDLTVSFLDNPQANFLHHINESGVVSGDWRYNQHKVIANSVVPSGVASVNDGFTHLDVTSENTYPAGFFGQISDSPNSILFMRAERTEYSSNADVLRVVFMADESAEASLDEFVIQLFSTGTNGESFDISEINIVDVTYTGNGGGFNEHWSSSNPVENQLTTSLEQPLHYYDAGGWTWNTYDVESFLNTSDTYDPQAFLIGQTFQSNELSGPSQDGYTLEFNIDSVLLADGITNGTQGSLTITIQSQSIDGNIYSMRLTGIDTAGDYKVNFNYPTEGNEFFNEIILSASENFEIELIDFSVQNQNILIGPSGNEGFYGKLDYIRIFNETTVVTAGGSEGWLFTQVSDEGNTVNVTTEGFVGYQDESIQLINAPNGVQVSQNVDIEVTEGEVYNVVFEVNHTSGNLEVYYIYQQITDTTALGFRAFLFPPDEVPETSFDSVIFDQNLTIEIIDFVAEGFGDNPDIVGSLVLRSTGADADVADIEIALDNITMIQVFDPGNFVEKTISYSEDVKGWVSFRSFIPESALSVSKKYFTVKDGELFQHYHQNSHYGTFYSEHFECHVEPIFNQAPDTVKTFNTLFYEGSQSQVLLKNEITSQEYNQYSHNGWFCYSITTDLEVGQVQEFIKKENKWFNNIVAKSLPASNNEVRLDFGKLSTQGIGTIASLPELYGEEEEENLDL